MDMSHGCVPNAVTSKDRHLLFSSAAHFVRGLLPLASCISAQPKLGPQMALNQVNRPKNLQKGPKQAENEAEKKPHEASMSARRAAE